MKTLGNLLLAISLTVGVLAAAPAYLVRLDRPDAELTSLTLGAPAGADGQPAEPIAQAGQALTPEILQQLRDANVQRVRVKEFAFGRWETRWFFVLAIIGLIGGAVLLRQDIKRRRSGNLASVGTTGATPEQSLAAIIQCITRLESELPGIADPQVRLETIADRIGEAQRQHVDAFVNARDSMVVTLGLSGVAAVMDLFSSGERQFNRAWSAAVDGVEPEAINCLQRARELFAETLKLLGQKR